MPVNECSLYMQSRPFPSILSREQEEVAFQVLNCLRESAKSSLRNSHRTLNYCYWAFPYPTGAHFSFLTNAFSSQESWGCSPCFWGAAITIPRARDRSMRHFQMQQSLCWAHFRQNHPDRFLHVAGWAQRKVGRCWRSSLAPSLLCVEGKVWASITDLAKISCPFVVSWIQTQRLLVTAYGNVSGQITLPTLLGIKKAGRKAWPCFSLWFLTFFGFFSWNNVCWLSIAFCFMEADG